MRTLLIIPFILVVLFAQVYAVDPSQQYTVSDGIEMQIPAGWVRIPQNVLDEYSRLEQTGVPPSVNMTADAGFQPAANDTWMQTPYVLVYVRTQRVPEHDLKNYKTMNERLKTEVSKIDPNASMLDITSPVYEPATHIIWMKMKKPAGANAIMGMKLTDKGTVATGLYFDDKDEKKYIPIFEQMVRGIKLREGLEYKEGFEFPLSEKALTFALLPFALGIGAWIKSRWKKRCGSRRPDVVDRDKPVEPRNPEDEAC